MNMIFRVAKVIAPTLFLAILLQLAIDGIQVFAVSAIGSAFVVFGPPAVGIGILVSAFLPVTKYTRRIVRVGRIGLPAIMIVAAWRILEYFQTYGDCQVVSGGFHETFCLTVGLQVFVWAPFLIVSAVILLTVRLKGYQYLPLPTAS